MRKRSWAPVILAVAAGLVFLLLGLAAWRFLDQENAFVRQRDRERLENAASLAIRETERAIAQSTRDPFSSPPLVWSSDVQPINDFPGTAFNAGEDVELAKGNPLHAIELYSQLLSIPASRPGALLRIARCYRKLGDSHAARATYQQLAQLGATPVAGAPAALVAFHQLGDRNQLQHTLESAAYPIDRATFYFYSEGLSIRPELLAHAEAASQLRHLSRSTPSATRLLEANGAYFLADWTTSVSHLIPMPVIAAKLELPAVRWNWTTASGTLLAGTLPATAQTGLLKRAAESGLPWNIRVDQPPLSSTASVLPLFALLGALILVTLYFAHRAIQRELQVAAAQSDFVAAVSHEFRTPITALTHLTELLDSGTASEDRKPLYYSALALETSRLRHMVENLLDFGRIEAGRYNYRPERLDLSELLATLLADFRQQPAAVGREINIHSAISIVHADREAIRRAVWNLLDNAVKYSPPGQPVVTEIHEHGRFTAIAVVDHGPGIPRSEHRDIFRKFVRGTAARHSQIKGTGIGLSMVDAIARAHGGHVRLDENSGGGCRFTLFLPREVQP